MITQKDFQYLSILRTNFVLYLQERRCLWLKYRQLFYLCGLYFCFILLEAVSFRNSISRQNRNKLDGLTSCSLLSWRDCGTFLKAELPYAKRVLGHRATGENPSQSSRRPPARKLQHSRATPSSPAGVHLLSNFFLRSH